MLTLCRPSQGGPAPDVLLRLWDMLMGLGEAAPAAAQAEQWDALNAWALLPAVFGESRFTTMIADSWSDEEMRLCLPRSEIPVQSMTMSRCVPFITLLLWRRRRRAHVTSGPDVCGSARSRPRRGPP